MPRKTVSFATLVVLLVPIDLASAASQSAMTEPSAVVRAVDPELRRLILEGHERSATFQRLVQEIRRSDG